MTTKKTSETNDLPDPVPLADVPGISMAIVELATARSLAQAAHNATTTQALNDLVMIATTARGVATILNGDKDAERLFQLLEKKIAG